MNKDEIIVKVKEYLAPVKENPTPAIIGFVAGCVVVILLKAIL